MVLPLNFRRFNGIRNLIPLRPIIENVNSHPLYVYRSIQIPIDFNAAIFALENPIR